MDDNTEEVINDSTVEIKLPTAQSEKIGANEPVEQLQRPTWTEKGKNDFVQRLPEEALSCSTHSTPLQQGNPTKINDEILSADPGNDPSLKKRERCEEMEDKDDLIPKKRPKEFKTWFPSSAHISTAVPVAVMPSALSLMVDEGILRMGEEAPRADTDYFDKRVVDAAAVRAIEEEREENKRRRLEVARQRAAEEQRALAAAMGASPSLPPSLLPSLPPSSRRFTGEARGGEREAGGKGNEEGCQGVEENAGEEGGESGDRSDEEGEERGGREKGEGLMGRSGGEKGREQGEGAAEEEGQGGGKESSGKEEMVVEEASTAAPPAVENGAHADLTRTPPASSSLPPSLPPSFLSDSSSSSHPSSLNGPGTARLPPPSAFAHLEQVASQHLLPPRPLSNPPSIPPSLPLVRGLADMSGYHSLEERMLRAVYRDLWERGLTIGSGGAYGADFTAYEGDPMAFHSFAAIIVLPASSPLSARALSASVRLEQSVVKLLVYAVCHRREGEEEHMEGRGEKRTGEGGENGGEEREKDVRMETSTFAEGKGKEGDVGTRAAITRFGWPRRSYVGGFMIEYMTLRFISVTRRME
ncbi:hypothetical protein Naga_100255g3 [Nannochloropsis gaditana]|uniref:tRNA-intron lyase n=2 Tax=Nannochloropsis gaditana TaxID=72520 RepID=W7TF33_9STRA|nr:hypothetical protein Naga_100255g3 [Nannochloropsis gaditana]